MKDRMTFTKWKRKLTPSGLSDNSLYEKGDNVTFPIDRLKDAIIEGLRVKIDEPKRMGGEPKRTLAYKITMDGHSWIVVQDPHFELCMLNPYVKAEHLSDLDIVCKSCGGKFIVTVPGDNDGVKEVKCESCGKDAPS